MKHLLVYFFKFYFTIFFLDLADNFLWFPHMWHHNHAHQFYEKDLENFMTQNKLFSEVYFFILY